MVFGKTTTPLDLIDYNDELRDQILEALRKRALDPDVYGILVWACGFLGLHRFYAGLYLTALGQFALALMSATLLARTILDLNFGHLPVIIVLISIGFAWWMCDLSMQKRTLLAAQFQREQMLLERLRTALPPS